MTDELQWSRPLRWASTVSGMDEEQLRGYLRNVRVAVRLEAGFDHSDARETFLLAVDMLLRFCPHLVLVIDDHNFALARKAQRLAVGILRTKTAVEVLTRDPNWNGFDVVLTIGRQPVDAARVVTVNSNGWVARLATESVITLPWRPTAANPIGALAASALAVGAAALILLRLPLANKAFELSLFEHREAPLGGLDFGPSLPAFPLDIRALLFGCGGVTNGWAYAIRRLRIKGSLEAVDKQTLHKENLGTYVLSSWADLDKPKSDLIRRVLKPKINVTSRPEPLEFYKIRLERGLVRLPGLVVAGLDDVPPRHVVQRLWPEMLIDMAGGGTTTQLLVHHLDQSGFCLIEALRTADGTPDFATRMAAATGLSPARIRDNPTDSISDEDVAAAPLEHRAALATAQRDGRLVCGRITDHNLYEEGYSNDFAPSVPFVSAFSGIVGAAETLKALMGFSAPLHHQFDFRSLRGRHLHLRRSPYCECTCHPGASRHNRSL
jgi:hypothetical protein